MTQDGNEITMQIPDGDIKIEGNWKMDEPVTITKIDFPNPLLH